jgi:hypothetical protein
LQVGERAVELVEVDRGGYSCDLAVVGVLPEQPIGPGWVRNIGAHVGPMRDPQDVVIESGRRPQCAVEEGSRGVDDGHAPGELLDSLQEGQGTLCDVGGGEVVSGLEIEREWQISRLGCAGSRHEEIGLHRRIHCGTKEMVGTSDDTVLASSLPIGRKRRIREVGALGRLHERKVDPGAVRCRPIDRAVIVRNVDSFDGGAFGAHHQPFIEVTGTPRWSATSDEDPHREEGSFQPIPGALGQP